MFDADRLRRTTWVDAQELADELFAIFKSIRDEGIQGPLKVVADGSSPPFEVVMPQGSDGPVITITIGDRTYEVPKFDTTFDPAAPPPTVPGVPPPPPPPPPTNAGSPLPDPTESGATGETGTPPDAMPFSTIGRVVDGTGRDYTVDLWLSDPEASDPYMRVPARALNLSPLDTIPPGIYVDAKCFYRLRNGKYAITAYITVGPAVWVEEP